MGGGGGEEAYAYRTRNADRARSHRTCPCRMAWRHNLQSQATLAHPPPGWTKTPLFLELSALKEHVATPCRQVGPIWWARHAMRPKWLSGQRDLALIEASGEPAGRRLSRVDMRMRMRMHMHMHTHMQHAHVAHAHAHVVHVVHVHVHVVHVHDVQCRPASGVCRTHLRRRAACPGEGAPRAPASGVPVVPRTAWCFHNRSLRSRTRGSG